jgi:signal peptidase II
MADPEDPPGLPGLPVLPLSSGLPPQSTVPDSLGAVTSDAPPPILSGAAFPAAPAAPVAAIAAPTEAPVEHRPSFVFFGLIAAISLLLDIGSKAWAEVVLGRRTMLDPAMVIIRDHLTLTLAYNKGGAWGLLQDASEKIRMPFFLVVSVLAIGFIVSLYGRLNPGQRALSWGLPLVLGGALGNLSDRIVRSSVIDFIDYRAGWVRSMNELVARFIHKGWSVTDHWPTFNVADISICIGVGLMAVDMLVSKRGPAPAPPAPVEASLSPAPVEAAAQPAVPPDPAT